MNVGRSDEAREVQIGSGHLTRHPYRRRWLDQIKINLMGILEIMNV